MAEGKKIFLEILAELREMNRVNKELLITNKENSKAIDQMSGYLTDYQKILDFVLEDNKKQHQQLMQKLRLEMNKAALLLKPEMIGLTRPNFKIFSDTNYSVYVQNKTLDQKMAENAVFATQQTNRAYYRTGFLSNLSTSAYQQFDEGYSTYIPSTQTLRVVSTSASDTTGGTGARTVTLSGLDGNFLRIFETINMNGTTPVLTTKQFRQIDSIFVTTVGSNQFAVGTISVTNTGATTTFGAVPPSFNTWQSGRFFTDANSTGFITSWTFGSYNATVRAVLRCSATGGTDGASVTRASAVESDNTIEVPFPIPIRVAKQGIVSVWGLAKGPNSEVTTSFELYTFPE